MRILITHDDYTNKNYGEWFAQRLRDAAGIDRFGVHELCFDADQADAILIVERGDIHYRDLCAHPLLKSHFAKCFVYDVQDWPIPYLPGLYASLPANSYRAAHHRAIDYLAPINNEIAKVAAEPAPDPDLLCSFVGGPTHRVRRQLFAGVPFGASPEVVIRRKEGWSFRDEMAKHVDVFQDYARLIRRSHFALCPRGIGTSSYRLFEAMELGRAPVILADAWVAPVGPPWERFSIRAPETELGQLPGLLRANLSRAAEMGREARHAWEEWFGPGAKFHRMAEWLSQVSRYPGSEAAIRSVTWRKMAATAWIQFKGRRLRRLFAKLAGRH